jgi:hypothetical protein
LAELVKEWASLEVEIQAVSKAELLLSFKTVGLCTEGESHVATAFLVTSDDLLADLLGKAEGEEAVLNLFLLCSNVFERVLILVHFHYIVLINYYFK